MGKDVTFYLREMLDGTSDISWKTTYTAFT